MEPLYKYRAGSPGLSSLVFLTGIALILFSVFTPFEGNEPVWLQWGLKIFLFLMGLLVFIAVPSVSLTAWPEYIEIQYGLTKFIRFRLAKDKITAVNAIEYNPMREFGGAGIKGGGGKWRGWTAFTVDLKTTALSIETTEKKYLISCPDPEEAETMLRNIVGIK